MGGGADSNHGSHNENLEPFTEGFLSKFPTITPQGNSDADTKTKRTKTHQMRIACSFF